MLKSVLYSENDCYMFPNVEVSLLVYNNGSMETMYGAYYTLVCCY